MAELLYRGYQVSNISIDEGIDVIAHKNNKTYYFQVKHKVLSGNFSVNITKSTYQKKSGYDYFLAIVLFNLNEKTRYFLIIPWAIIDNWIDNKLINDIDDKYQINIKYIDNKFTLKNEVLDRYLGERGWDKIK